MCNDCRSSYSSGIFTVIAVSMLVLVPALFFFSFMSGNGHRQMDTKEVRANVGNPDGRTLNEAMRLKKTVRIAMEVFTLYGRNDDGLYSNTHGNRSVKFVDDSTRWDFGALMPEKRRIVPLQAGITYNPTLPQGMQFGYTSGGSSSDCNTCIPGITVIEGVPVSSEQRGNTIVYQVRLSQDLLD